MVAQGEGVGVAWRGHGVPAGKEWRQGSSVRRVEVARCNWQQGNWWRREIDGDGGGPVLMDRGRRRDPGVGFVIFKNFRG